jgi:hypothetical protein
MRDLWKGLAMIALDADLRQAVAARAKFNVVPGLADEFRNQPDLNALRDIDSEFRARGLVMGTYALSEINRWFLDGGPAFLEALSQFRNALTESLPVGSNLQSAGFLEAVGALVADPQLRDGFSKHEQNLRDHAFIISEVEEAALRQDFEPASPADTLAARIFELGWSTGSCEGGLLVYDGMFHFNH